MQPARPRAGSAASKKPRPTRCMQCATCLKPQLKKACLRNKALRSAGSLTALDEPSPAGADLAGPPPSDAAPAPHNRCRALPSCERIFLCFLHVWLRSRATDQRRDELHVEAWAATCADFKVAMTEASQQLPVPVWSVKVCILVCGCRFTDSNGMSRGLCTAAGRAMVRRMRHMQPSADRGASAFQRTAAFPCPSRRGAPHRPQMHYTARPAARTPAAPRPRTTVPQLRTAARVLRRRPMRRGRLGPSGRVAGPLRVLRAQHP